MALLCILKCIPRVKLIELRILYAEYPKGCRSTTHDSNQRLSHMRHFNRSRLVGFLSQALNFKARKLFTILSHTVLFLENRCDRCSDTSEEEKRQRQNGS